MMIYAAGKVFTAHQQYGLLVIDPSEDKVVQTISMDIVESGAGIGSIVKSIDGYLWLSVAKNTQGTGATSNHIVRVDPVTLQYEVISIEQGMYPPANSWYAWTPDAFVASSVQNCLYWKGGANRWFNGTKIYKFDCDTRTQSLFINLDEEGADWKLYGCAIGVHPETDEIYMALYHEFAMPTYITRRYSPLGEKIRDYDMIQNYWFPSLPIFTQASQDNSIISEIIDDSISNLGAVYDLQGRCIKKNVDFGKWAGLEHGIYIWKNAKKSFKFIVE